MKKDYNGNLKKKRGHFFKLKIALVAISMCLSVLPAHALEMATDTATHTKTQATITGTVLDPDGMPLPGVNILVKGTTTGTQSDFDGNYFIEAANDATLVFSYLGFKTQTLAINNRTNIDVSLEEDAGQLDEVVVVGYGTQRKQDLTGAISVVKVDELVQQPTAQITSQLQGRVSGVTITGGGQPGQAPQIKIRGANTFGNNSPLYVVDGIPTETISDINPNDIESLQVLKDAASASIYGARAANGVIIVSTKKGKGRMRVSYDTYYGIQMVQKGNPWDILSSQETAELTFQALRNTNPDQPINHSQYGNGATPVLPNYIAPVGANTVNEALYNVNPLYTDPADVNNFYRIVKANKEGTNWFQEIFNPASITSHNVSVSNGTEKGSYYLSLNYFNQQGTIENTYLKRYTIRANATYDITDKIRIGQNLSFAIRDNPQIDALTEGSTIGMAFRELPIIPVRDINGNYAGSFGSDLGNAKNPVAIAERRRNNRGISNRVFGNIFVEVDFAKNFTFRTSYGGQYFSNSFNSFQFPEYENAENLTINQYTEAAATNYNWTWTNTVQYKNVFNEKHNLTVLLGTEAYQNRGREVGGTTQSYFSFDPDYVTLDTGAGTQTNYSFKYADALSSLFGRLDYNFNDKYLLSATIRRDGSSRFLNEQYGWFPAASVGWNILNEKFMPDMSWLNDLKIRGGYGVRGNQINVDPPNGFTTYGGNNLNSYYDISGSNNSTVEGFRQTRIGNPDAKWERDADSNIGIDASLFNRSVQLSVDYYRKDISDLLYNPNQVATVGTATVPFQNVAEMKNTGLDIDLSTYFNLSDELRLNTSVTFTSYNNEIVSISEGQQFFDAEGRRFNGSNIIRNAVGHSLSQFFGYQTVGFWDSQNEIDQANAAAIAATGNNNATYQSDVAIGRFRYADTNGDNQITEADRTFLGNPNPDFTYGLNIEVLYKNWDFSMFLYGSQGNDIWNQVKWWTDFYSSFVGAKSNTALYDSWTPTNRNASAPIQQTTGSFSLADVPNSYFVEDGSYLRAKQIQLGYSLPSKMLQSMNLTKLRVYAQMANAFTLTSYSGIDPEIAGGGAVNTGIDEGAYPNQRQLLFGLNAAF
ncbi:SusC/RagA family TonB-linked outer membrane protein [Leeuwenhoekiella polynyae]|uniref:TonB-linked SusC/RagA family outer membrane protein n=1 Tax=Leeuwenhoekiella polynyae TaxID=1550906 RepID=A0A4Q0NN07_9FLAO|nr:TonB-dependent receptor [Leeuwenhoekiella polynyae]RXG11242.1 TonB-linked SusC/RagA family outer membrane protein [Leeuwenhoekiella polynyae]